MTMKLLDQIALALFWRTRRAGRRPHPVVTFEGRFEFWRFEPFWPDEWNGRNRPPWWRPFNALLHYWKPDKDAHEPFHDHPRWTVTIVLRGRIVEETPWTRRELRPGSIVVRSRKSIHRFFMPPGQRTAWTLFLVGRRDHRQNTYQVEPR